MKKKIIPCLFIFALSLLPLFADFKSDYELYIRSENLEKLESILPQWEQAEPNNPEMFIAYFNYYLLKGRSSGLTIDTVPPESGTSIAFSDPDTGETVGYIGGQTSYDRAHTETALEYLNKGLAIAPERLDMHFGQITILGELKEYNRMAEKIIEVFGVAQKINHKWLWSNNEPMGNDAENIMLESINDYHALLLTAKDTKAKEAEIKVCLAQTKAYPKNIYAYNFLGAVYMQTGEDKKALEAFLAAEKVNPSDGIVLGNIGKWYADHGDTQNAKKYYKRMLKDPDTRIQKFARKRLDELDKK
ncbi:tetratricopeptide repeat protein [Treponema sp. OMZ 840]|uniref:tetratricopeptide repeat protein n=1 Tax=Treponema sp. OMZ 840 TaxID=244313 RepID=UPI003D8D0031